MSNCGRNSSDQVVACLEQDSKVWVEKIQNLTSENVNISNSIFIIARSIECNDHIDLIKELENSSIFDEINVYIILLEKFDRTVRDFKITHSIELPVIVDSEFILLRRKMISNSPVFIKFDENSNIQKCVFIT